MWALPLADRVELAAAQVMFAVECLSEVRQGAGYPTSLMIVRAVECWTISVPPVDGDRALPVEWDVALEDRSELCRLLAIRFGFEGE